MSRVGRCAARGFTLIELTVVMLLIAIVFSVTAPRLAGRTQAAKLRAAGADAQALAASARARAVLHGYTVSVRMDDEGRTFSLVAASGNRRAKANDDNEPVEDNIGPARRLPGGVSARFVPDGDEEPDRLAFRPDGSGSGGTLSLMLEGGEQLELQLYEPLGRLRTVVASSR